MKTNTAVARRNMVEQQIRPWDVLDQRVLDLIAVSPREDYVPAAYREQAYVDIFIPLTPQRAMLTPKLEARLLQELDIDPSDTILEVGSGCGSLTSLLAALGKHVYSIDSDPALLASAQKNLAAHEVNNITLEQGDALTGWPQHAPYDVIVITGSVPRIPDQLKAELNIGGRLFVVVGKSPVMEAMLIRRTGKQNWEESALFETDIQPLTGENPPAEFIF